MSLYVLYHQKTNPERVGIYQTAREKFENLYEKYKIDMVGFWSVEGNESENYLLYKYDNEEDYETKVGLLQKDSEYLALREEIQETRLSIEEIRLVPLWIPE
ncbi:MAG: hypothetical protein ACXADC_07270 [Candidatus Thorarchaeota archaeon]